MSKLDQELASKLCHMEGKTSQVKIGDMREILACIKKIAWQTHQIDERGVNTLDGEVKITSTTSLVHQWLNQEIKKLARAKARQAKKVKK